MPFEDEVFTGGVVISPYRPQWAIEGQGLVDRLAELLPDAVSVDHIGSTAVPGLAAKDCVDAMVSMRSLGAPGVGPLVRAGFRERPERWNRVEALDGVEYPKRVFAPPVGERTVNVHVRIVGSPTARYALLFRDYLRADSESRQAWGELKVRVASVVPDLAEYGQVKLAAMPLLMASAERWASATDWAPRGQV